MVGSFCWYYFNKLRSKGYFLSSIICNIVLLKHAYTTHCVKIMVVVEFSQKGEFYMLVSAVTSCCQSVYNLKSNTRGSENCADTSFSSLNAPSRLNSCRELAKVYDSINEWKHFCHKQIVDGELDIIA